jgi:hypothetical protein
MTRARKELIFSCPKELTSGERSKSVSPSAFFAEAGQLPEQDGSLKNPEQASTLLFRSQREVDIELASFLRERLENFALSVSGVNRFLDDPIHFLRIDLLQVPQLSDYALAYGNAVHWALRQWALRMQRGMPMGKEEVLGEFRNYLLEREFLTDAEMRRLLHLGEEAIPRYFDERLQGATPYIEGVERDFTTRLIDPSTPLGMTIPIKGKIDRIDRDHPESAIGSIIDYKTGRPKTESEIKDSDYERQLQFYAVLLEEALPSLKPKAFILEFIGERDEHPVSRAFQVSEEQKTQMRALIATIWKKINALDFTPL